MAKAVSRPKNLIPSPCCLRVLYALLAFFLLASYSAASFKQDQMRYSRVREAYQKKEAACEGLFLEKNLAYPPKQLFIRVFKNEKILEVWSASEPDATYQLLKQYPVCSLSGALGPKRKEGEIARSRKAFTISTGSILQADFIYPLA
jgi:murein L,D-transpeptidase YafK